MSRLPTFTQARLFLQAMTHKSYAREFPDAEDNNERLEFLGDAILTFLCGEFLFRRYPAKAEGELTPLRSSLVDATQLGKFAQQLELDRYLRLGRGVEGSGGRRNTRLLSSAFEALVGAYFLDQASVEPVRAFVFPLFEAVVEDMADPTRNINEKSALQEWSLARSEGVPIYEIIGESGPDHDKQFTAIARIGSKLVGRGVGRRKQDAEKAAARNALQKLGILP